MSSLKILNRGVLVRNYLLFLMMGPLFSFILWSLGTGEGTFNLTNLIQYAYKNVFILLVSLLTVISVYSIRKISHFFITLYLITFGFVVFWPLLTDFDKGIFVLGFIYLMIFILFWLFWGQEIKDVVYRPALSIFHLDKRSEYNLKCLVTFENGEESWGQVSNWDRSGVFIVFDKPINMPNGKIEFTINFVGRTFIQKGLIISKYGNAIGVKIEKSDKILGKTFNWEGLYEILEDRGYIPFGERI